MQNIDNGFLFIYFCLCSVGPPVFLDIKLVTMRRDKTKTCRVDFPAQCTTQPVKS